MTVRPRDVVVVGASAGGVEALRATAAQLPADLPAAVLVALHMPAGGTSALPAILDRAGPLPAQAARNGEPMEHGRVYVAPPDHHLLVSDGTVALSHGPTENGHRPAINALFRSAAVARGASVTGVLLSGVLDDGVAGLQAIAGQGGRVVVQDPRDALYPAMPEKALRALTPDHVVAASEIGEVLAKVTLELVEADSGPAPEPLRWENEIASAGRVGVGVGAMGKPSEFACPDCHGVLADIDHGVRYRCRVGHAWTAEALVAAQGDTVERALWTGMRALEEKASLCRRLAALARERRNDLIAGRYEAQARETIEAAEVLRRQMVGRG
ncbi:chemotaxis protein CheB [Amycolatopsis balhimycina DSM 5908]|uniref:protein-glutamate methylesterase n=1 Tax=Amycolatopsis balhimycina DSM 5908 TaxID=1081091 RepID=A0A428W3M1_AMYBA|nr:chemotaxis protein CheB [Amycolatopsis balhimycina]RSM37633.1 chemotaxis protein CheB [Amycolatopsis balhimycina DSM 5908]